jgi:hypothetical protein
MKDSCQGRREAEYRLPPRPQLAPNESVNIANTAS